MSRLLLFNLRTDADDHILGFTTQWINALAEEFDHIDVLTTHQGRLAVAANVTVYSVGREKGYSQARRLWEFYRILLGLLLRHRYTACFAHMQPLFATLGGLPLTLRGVPLTTWYTHRQLNWQVKGAVRCSKRVVSAVEDSFPMTTPKLRVTGHGIETDFFVPAAHPPINRPRIVQVARLTAIKHQATLLRAIVPLDCEVVLVGDIPDGFDDTYKQDLLVSVQQLGVTDRVFFAGAQTPEQVRIWYQTAALAINLSPPGLFDKAALEAMACGVPTLVSSEAFLPVTQPYSDLLHVPFPTPVDTLSERLKTLLTMPAGERAAIGNSLRQQVIAQHSLALLMQRLVNVLRTGEIETKG